MESGIFSVYDSKAECYLPPFFMRNRAMAVRAFQASVMEPGSDLNRFPEDYALFVLGTFDDSTGAFTLLAAPQSVVGAWALAAAAKAERGDK